MFLTGWFTCIVDAESVGTAVEKFHDLLESLALWFTGFDTVAVIYLEDITEVGTLPSAGVLAYIQMHPEDRFAHISTSLPGVPDEFCHSYGWSEGEEAVEPFVSFEE